MNRADHLIWCKRRALEILEEGNISGAFDSMVSDLRKHPELQNHAGIELGMVLMFSKLLSTYDQMKRFIEGFN